MATDSALAGAVEEMGRRLHGIDHGQVMPPFELCMDMACDVRWGLVEAKLPGRRNRALKEWRFGHPNHWPNGWTETDVRASVEFLSRESLA